MPFKNRSEAGRRLAVALAGYKEQEPTILALPRGGVAVAGRRLLRRSMRRSI
jgi:putative phosphoribosyl transferase